MSHKPNYGTRMSACFLALFMFFGCTYATPIPQASKDLIQPTPDPPVTTKKIKLALLLDTSSSMDGLIDQAKSQLWKIVNELAKAKVDNDQPTLEIALYEYGNDGLPVRENYIRMVTSLTSDLDKISEDLFTLTTNGGSEFCGAVIDQSVRALDWARDSEDLQLIFIAGNEEFTQGAIHYNDACQSAKAKDIVVNTIFCGNYEVGISSRWQAGAVATGGKYMNIDHNQKTVYIESPFDEAIQALNDKLNATYLSYGKKGRAYQSNQSAQDQNSYKYGKSNATERIVSKSSHIYYNGNWDLIDARQEKDFDITKVKTETLPKEMQKMSHEERLKYIEQKSKEREVIKEEIKNLSKKRQAYIDEKRQEQSTEDNSLDAAMIRAIHAQAAAKNFTF